MRSRQLSDAVSPTLLRFNQSPYAVIKSNTRSSSPVNINVLRISSILLRFHQLSCIFRRPHQLSCALVTIVFSHQFSNTLVRASSLKLSSTIKSSHQPCALFSSQALRLLSTFVRSHQLSNAVNNSNALSTLVRYQISCSFINTQALSKLSYTYFVINNLVLTSILVCCHVRSHQLSCALHQMSYSFINSCAFSSTLVRTHQLLCTLHQLFCALINSRMLSLTIDHSTILRSYQFLYVLINSRALYMKSGIIVSSILMRSSKIS